MPVSVVLVECQLGADVNCCGDNIVTTLTAVDVVVGVYGLPQLTTRETGDDLVCIHISAGAGTGLENINGKLILILSLCYRGGGIDNALR